MPQCYYLEIEESWFEMEILLKVNIRLFDNMLVITVKGKERFCVDKDATWEHARRLKWTSFILSAAYLEFHEWDAARDMSATVKHVHVYST